MYGEKADIRPLFGEGIKGDRNAIMMMRNGGAEFILQVDAGQSCRGTRT